jgi:hypothetical protein
MVRQISFCGNALDHASHGIRRTCRTGASKNKKEKEKTTRSVSSRLAVSLD